MIGQRLDSDRNLSLEAFKALMQFNLSSCQQILMSSFRNWLLTSTQTNKIKSTFNQDLKRRAFNKGPLLRLTISD